VSEAEPSPPAGGGAGPGAPPPRRSRGVALAAQDEHLTRRVGAIALVLLVAAIAFALFVAPGLAWGRRITVRVYFHDTGGLREGAAVVAGGRAIGRIESIGLLRHGAPGPLGGDEGVTVTASIAAGAAGLVSRDGDVFISSRGPIGERYLEIGPGAATAPRPLADGDELRGRDPPTLDRVLERTWTNLNVARDFGREIRPELDLLRRALARLGETLDGLAGEAAAAGGLVDEALALRAEARRLRDVGLGGDRGLAQLDAIVAGARALLAQARGVMDALDPAVAGAMAGARAMRDRLAARGPGVVERVELAIARGRAAVAKIDPLLARVQELRARVARGEGSLGRLMADPEFPEDAKELGKILKRQPWKIIARPKD